MAVNALKKPTNAKEWTTSFLEVQFSNTSDPSILLEQCGAHTHQIPIWSIPKLTYTRVIVISKSYWFFGKGQTVKTILLNIAKGFLDLHMLIQMSKSSK